MYRRVSPTTSHIDNYKRRSGAAIDKRFLRARNKNIYRKNHRDVEMARRRNIVISPLKERSELNTNKLSNLTEEIDKTKTDLIRQRHVMLQKWKAEKILQRQYEALNKKKVFKVGAYTPDKPLFLSPHNVKPEPGIKHSFLQSMSTTLSKKLIQPKHEVKNIPKKALEMKSKHPKIEASIKYFAPENFTFDMQKLSTFTPKPLSPSAADSFLIPMSTSTDSGRNSTPKDIHKLKTKKENVDIRVQSRRPDFICPSEKKTLENKYIEAESSKVEKPENTTVENKNLIESTPDIYDHSEEIKIAMETEQALQDMQDLKMEVDRTAGEIISSEIVLTPLLAENKTIKNIQNSACRTPSPTGCKEFPIEGSPWITIRCSTDSKRKKKNKTVHSQVEPGPLLIWDDHDDVSKTEHEAFETQHENVRNAQTIVSTVETNDELEPEMKKIRLDEVKECQTDLSVKYFRDLLKSETARLIILCNVWASINKSTAELTEEMSGEIRTVIGQAELLMNQRFNQFSGLVDNCEFKTGEKEITCTDLQGFWDMIYFQVEDVNNKFCNLEQLQENNWQKLKKPEAKISKKKLSKITTTARNQVHSMAVRERLAKAKAAAKISQQNKPQSGQLEVKVFEAGFFNIYSPVRKPESLCESENKTPLKRMTPRLRAVTGITCSPVKSPFCHLKKKKLCDTSPLACCAASANKSVRYSCTPMSLEKKNKVNSVLKIPQATSSMDFIPLDSPTTPRWEPDIPSVSADSSNYLEKSLRSRISRKNRLGAQFVQFVKTITTPRKAITTLNSSKETSVEEVLMLPAESFKSSNDLEKSTLKSSGRRSTRSRLNIQVLEPSPQKIITQKKCVINTEKSLGENNNLDCQNVPTEITRSALKSGGKRSRTRLSVHFDDDSPKNYSTPRKSIVTPQKRLKKTSTEEVPTDKTSSHDSSYDSIDSSQEFVGRFTRLRVNFTPGINKERLSLLFTPIQGKRRSEAPSKISNDLMSFSPEEKGTPKETPDVFKTPSNKRRSRSLTPGHKPVRRRSVRLAAQTGGSLLLP